MSSPAISLGFLIMLLIVRGPVELWRRLLLPPGKVRLVYVLSNNRLVSSLDENRDMPYSTMLLWLWLWLLLWSRALLPLRLLLLLLLLFSLALIWRDFNSGNESRLAISLFLVVPVLRGSRHGANVALLLGVLHVVLVLSDVNGVAQPVLGYLLLVVRLLLLFLGIAAVGTDATGTACGTATARLGPGVLVRLIVKRGGSIGRVASAVATGEGHVGPGWA